MSFASIVSAIRPFSLIFCLILQPLRPACATTALSCLNEALHVAAIQSCSLTGNSSLLFQANDPFQAIYVDLSTKGSSLSSPWSYRPFCTQYFEELSSELCVYTNFSFSNGRGISIFTTPSIAQDFATLQPFHDSTVLHGVNEGIRSWYTKEVPGKGTAMIAKKKLGRGDHLTAFTPVLIVNVDKILPIHENEIFLRRAIDQLPSKTRSAYLSLSRMYDDPAVLIQDILKSNAFEIQVAGKMHLAIFPEPARLNHDCAPK
jgi:hypothetical protein